MAEEFDAEKELMTIKEKLIKKNEISNVTKQTDFTKVMEEGKINILKQASVDDEKFVSALTETIKDASIKSAEVEKEKQELEKKHIQHEQTKIDTQEQKEINTQRVDKWDNKQKARQYHYDGLKDIMKFVHIEHPMWIPLMYFIAFLVTPIYLAWTLILCPIGTLIAGTNDKNRPALVKGAIYTLLFIALVIAVGFGIYACMHYVFKWF